MSGETSSKRTRTGKTKKPAGRTRQQAAGASSSAPLPETPDFHSVARSNPNFYVPPNSFNDYFFVSQRNFKLYERHFEKAIIMRPVWFDMNNMVDCDLRAVLESQGWLRAIKISRKYSPTLIKMFYANMNVGKEVSRGLLSKDTGTLTTMVLGVRISVNVAMINRLLGTPNAGDCAYSTRGPIRGMISPMDQWASISRHATVGDPITLPYLDPFKLILFHVITRFVHPRDGCLSEMTGMDTWIMHNLLRRNALNLGYLVLNHMGKDRVPKSKGATAHLPYAYLIMLILEEHGIIFPPSQEFSSHCRKYDANHIFAFLKLMIMDGRLAYARQRGKFHPSVVGEGAAENENVLAGEEMLGDEELDDSQDEDEDEDANFADPGDLSAQMAELRVSMHSRMDQLQAYIQTRFNGLEEYNRDMFQAIVGRLPPPPPQ